MIDAGKAEFDVGMFKTLILTLYPNTAPEDMVCFIIQQCLQYQNKLMWLFLCQLYTFKGPVFLLLFLRNGQGYV